MQHLESKLAQGGQALNVYFTAGFPQLDSLPRILHALERAGVDLVEIGIPFSDPIADGPTIQAANQQALDNGMTLRLLLSQLEAARPSVPVLLMGYFNSVLQFGVEDFLARAKQAGVAGLILPDLPVEVYEQQWRGMFERHGLGLTFLVTPRSSEARIRQLDAMTQGFLYVVSSPSITGGTGGIQDGQVAYFERLNAMGLQKPRLIGFGISGHQDFRKACAHAHGAIVGSAFIRHLGVHGDDPAAIHTFVQQLRGPHSHSAL